MSRSSASAPITASARDAALGRLLARWSYLDLNDGAVAGGYLDDTTFGLNWYLNSYMRVMFNWIHADQDRGAVTDVETDIYAMRFDVHF